MFLLNLAQKDTLHICACFVLLTLLTACSDQQNEKHTSSAAAHQAPIRLAVLGDSDSHSYGDRIWLPEDSGKRGGLHRETTLQWTEILAKLRSPEIDQGKWGIWGNSALAAKLTAFTGIHLRSPEKEDFEYNFAWSGASCEALTRGVRAQTRQLTYLLSQQPAGWRNGVVQIRIGANDLGTSDFLNRAAVEGLSPAIAQEVNACSGHIVTSVQLLRQQFPQINILLVGILNNSDWPPYFGHWQSGAEQQSINLVLDSFDNQLRELAATDKHTAFFDDRAWFRQYWGKRDQYGKPNYTVHTIAAGITVSNTQGDTPEHGVLMDGHAGTLVNALRVRDFIDFLNKEFGLGIRPVTQTELVEFSRTLTRE